ncbi:Os11g0131500, partial [Oryza sativa Japonica Group]
MVSTVIRFKSHQFCDHLLAEFQLAMNATGPDQRPVYRSIWHDGHSVDQLLGIVKSTSPAQHVNHASVMLNTWLNPEFDLHSVKVVQTFIHQSSMGTSTHHGQHSDAIHRHALTVHSVEQGEGSTAMAMDCQAMEHRIVAACVPVRSGCKDLLGQVQPPAPGVHLHKRGGHNAVDGEP